MRRDAQDVKDAARTRPVDQVAKFIVIPLRNGPSNANEMEISRKKSTSQVPVNKSVVKKMEFVEMKEKVAKWKKACRR